MTLSSEQLETLSAWLAEAGLDGLELSGPGLRVRLRRAAPPSRAPVPEGPLQAPLLAEAEPKLVRSPGIGRFLRAHPLHREPLVQPDQPVKAGQPVGLLRNGTVLIPVPAPRAGIVAEIVAAEGALLGWGDPVLSIWPEA